MEKARGSNNRTTPGREQNKTAAQSVLNLLIKY